MAKNAIKLTALQIVKLKVQLARLRRMRFCQSFERQTLLAGHLGLALEDLYPSGETRLAWQGGERS